jgi:hypothetical protein
VGGFFQVPVIVVFTKFDQFKRDVKTKLEDQHRDLEIELDNEVERVFNKGYLAGLTERPLFIRLESEDFVGQCKLYYINSYPPGMHKHGQRCADLVEMTANSLCDDALVLMLLAVQKDNLELSINQAIKW